MAIQSVNQIIGSLSQSISNQLASKLINLAFSCAMGKGEYVGESVRMDEQISPIAYESELKGSP